jgi:hypothetical protein
MTENAISQTTLGPNFTFIGITKKNVKRKDNFSAYGLAQSVKPSLQKDNRKL